MMRARKRPGPLPGCRAVTTVADMERTMTAASIPPDPREPPAEILQELPGEFRSAYGRRRELLRGPEHLRPVPWKSLTFRQVREYLEVARGGCSPPATRQDHIFILAYVQMRDTGSLPPNRPWGPVVQADRAANFLFGLVRECPDLLREAGIDFEVTPAEIREVASWSREENPFAREEDLELHEDLGNLPDDEGHRRAVKMLLLNQFCTWLKDSWNPSISPSARRINARAAFLRAVLLKIVEAEMWSHQQIPQEAMRALLKASPREYKVHWNDRKGFVGEHDEIIRLGREAVGEYLRHYMVEDGKGHYQLYTDGEFVHLGHRQFVRAVKKAAGMPPDESRVKLINSEVEAVADPRSAVEQAERSKRLQRVQAVLDGHEAPEERATIIDLACRLSPDLRPYLLPRGTRFSRRALAEAFGLKSPETIRKNKRRHRLKMLVAEALDLSPAEASTILGAERRGRRRTA